MLGLDVFAGGQDKLPTRGIAYCAAPAAIVTVRSALVTLKKRRASKIGIANIVKKTARMPPAKPCRDEMQKRQNKKF